MIDAEDYVGMQNNGARLNNNAATRRKDAAERREEARQNGPLSWLDESERDSGETIVVASCVRHCVR